MSFSRTPQFNISFVDLLFNLLIAFIVLAIVAVVHINPPTKKEEAPRKAELLITVDWHNTSKNDVDSWLLGPKFVHPIYYQARSMPPFLLDRDDVGTSSDLIEDSSGNKRVIQINREVITMRGWGTPGEYFFNLHYYHALLGEPEVVDVVVATVNPYRVIHKSRHALQKQWQEIDVVSFRITDDKKIVDVTPNHGVFFAQQYLENAQRAYDNVGSP